MDVINTERVSLLSLNCGSLTSAFEMEKNSTKCHVKTVSLQDQTMSSVNNNTSSTPKAPSERPKRKVKKATPTEDTAVASSSSTETPVVEAVVETTVSPTESTTETTTTSPPKRLRKKRDVTATATETTDTTTVPTVVETTETSRPETDASTSSDNVAEETVSTSDEITTTVDELIRRRDDIYNNILLNIDQQHQLQKDHRRHLKDLRGIEQQLIREAKKKKKKTKQGNRNPSGFNKEQPISDELCDFLDLPRGTMIARTAVTKRLTEYIKANNLEEPERRRVFILNDTLRHILGNPPDQEEVTYFNVQKYLCHHFPPSKKAMLERRMREEAASSEDGVSVPLHR